VSGLKGSEGSDNSGFSYQRRIKIPGNVRHEVLFGPSTPVHYITIHERSDL
jgi:hypothetical protein